MATTKEYRDYVLEQLSDNNITCRPMMGEYILYYDGVIFGGIYDDRLLVKKTDSNSKYSMEEAIPYDGAKSMYLVDTDDIDTLKEIILDTYNNLK